MFNVEKANKAELIHRIESLEQSLEQAQRQLKESVIMPEEMTEKAECSLFYTVFTLSRGSDRALATKNSKMLYKALRQAIKESNDE